MYNEAKTGVALEIGYLSRLVMKKAAEVILVSNGSGDCEIDSCSML